MSVQALYSAATGMSALQTKLDVIANNLANVSTTAFKEDQTNFEDLLYRHEKMPGIQDSAGQYTPTGIQIGMGSRVSSVQDNFSQGPFLQTGNELDVAIAGRGFFQVADPATGNTLYSRAGNFAKNANGNLVVGSASVGRLIQPTITIPNDATAISVSSDGKVTVAQPGSTNMNQVGQIELASFVNPQGLLKLGENLYSQTDSSGSATLGNPGQNGMGTLQQNMLESSNVEPVTELIGLITTQRAFEMKSQVIKAGDEILQTVANLTRA
jgi:flagellar basal-body rod protein FlgG